REEAKTAELTHGPDLAATIRSSNGLGSVFNHRQVALCGNLQDWIHICRKPKEMDGHDGASATANGAEKFSGIEIKSFRLDINKHRPCAQTSDGSGRSHKSKRRSNYLVVGTYLQRH